jgi:hypothetical protein
MKEIQVSEDESSSYHHENTESPGINSENQTSKDKQISNRTRGEPLKAKSDQIVSIKGEAKIHIKLEDGGSDQENEESPKAAPQYGRVKASKFKQDAIRRDNDLDAGDGRTKTQPPMKMPTFARASIDLSTMSNNPVGGDNPRITKQELLGLYPKEDKIPFPKTDDIPPKIDQSPIHESLSELENSATEKFSKKAKSDEELEELSYQSRDANATSSKRDQHAPKEPKSLTARSNKRSLAKNHDGTLPVDYSLNSGHSVSIEPEKKSVIQSLMSILDSEGEEGSEDPQKRKKKTLNLKRKRDLGRHQSPSDGSVSEMGNGGFTGQNFKANIQQAIFVDKN